MSDIKLHSLSVTPRLRGAGDAEARVVQPYYSADNGSVKADS
jgi:hypothetical protein